MNYWHMQIHPSGQAAEFAPHLAGILARGIIGLGEWPQGAAAIRAFKETMQTGDIVAVKRGGELVALVEVAGDAYTVAPADDPDPHSRWMAHRRPVRVLDWADGSARIPHNRGTLVRCADMQTATSQIIRDWHLRVTKAV